LCSLKQAAGICGLLIRGNLDVKVYCHIEIFWFLFPKKNYNEKTLVFYPGKGAKNIFWVKKLQLFHPELTMF